MKLGLVKVINEPLRLPSFFKLYFDVLFAHIYI